MFDTLEKSSIADRIQGIEKSLKDAVDGLDLKNCTNEELSGLLLSLGVNLLPHGSLTNGLSFGSGTCIS